MFKAQSASEETRVAELLVAIDLRLQTGPVNAIGKALLKALLPYYPTLQYISLIDFKVRILDNASATGAKTRVMIDFHDSFYNEQWVSASTTLCVMSYTLSSPAYTWRACLQGRISTCLLACSVQANLTVMLTKPFHPRALSLAVHICAVYSGCGHGHSERQCVCSGRWARACTRDIQFILRARSATQHFSASGSRAVRGRQLSRVMNNSRPAPFDNIT